MSDNTADDLTRSVLPSPTRPIEQVHPFATAVLAGQGYDLAAIRRKLHEATHQRPPAPPNGDGWLPPKDAGAGSGAVRASCCAWAAISPALQRQAVTH